MTLALERTRRLLDQQHIVLDDVSWDFYERVLAEVGDRPIRVTFSDGSIEIMSPLLEHEWIKKAIASLLELLTIELNIVMTRFGSSTSASICKASRTPKHMPSTSALMICMIGTLDYFAEQSYG